MAVAAEIESERGLERQRQPREWGSRHAVGLVGGCWVAGVVLGCCRCTSEWHVQYSTRGGVTMSRAPMKGGYARQEFNVRRS